MTYSNTSAFNPVYTPTDITQSGVISFATSLGPSGGYYYTRKIVTYPEAFKSGEVPGVAFGLAYATFNGSSASSLHWFMEENQLSPNPNNAQFEVTIVTTAGVLSGNLYWVAQGEKA